MFRMLLTENLSQVVRRNRAMVAYLTERFVEESIGRKACSKCTKIEPFAPICDKDRSRNRQKNSREETCGRDEKPAGKSQRKDSKKPKVNLLQVSEESYNEDGDYCPMVESVDTVYSMQSPKKLFPHLLNDTTV